MRKAHVRPLAFGSHQDPDTGARVTRLTPTDITCHRTYFYQKCFTNDGQKLVFGAQWGEHWNYHLLDLQAQTATQLSDQAGENTFGGFLSPDDRWLYFVRAERQLIRLDLTTLHEEVVYTVPPDWVGYGTWVANSDCTMMVGIEIRASDWFELSDWAQFVKMFHTQPRCRLIRIHLANGARDVIHEDQRWLGHPQYRPFDDHTIAFCHEGPHDLIDARMWLVDEDGSNVRCAKEHAAGESCTHEFWVPDGSAMIYVSYLQGQQERTIHALDPVTLHSKVLTTMPPCSHLMSNYDGSLIVGDGANTPVDVSRSDAHAVANDPYLHLFDLRAGTQRSDDSTTAPKVSHRRIARHDSSWRVHKGNRQVTHPHPSFAPGDQQVLYTSDCEGEPALYLADL